MKRIVLFSELVGVEFGVVAQLCSPTAQRHPAILEALALKCECVRRRTHLERCSDNEMRGARIGLDEFQSTHAIEEARNGIYR